MLTLLAILVLFGLLLAGVLTAWAMFFQARIYTEPSPGLAWRGPAAGGAILLVVLLWAFAAYQAPGRFRPFWESSSTEDSPMIPELRVPNSATGGEDIYKLRRGTREYTIGGRPNGNPLPDRPLPHVVAVEREGDEVRKSTFKPERDEAGQFVQRERRSWFGGSTKEPLRYIDENGRVMYEKGFGQLSQVRGSWFLGNVLLNLLLLAVTFVALWLVLNFQLAHALGQAVVVWIMLLFALTPLLSKVEAVAKQRADEARRAERPAGK